MMASDNNESGSGKGLGPWFGSAIATALVGAVFSIVILTLIVANYVQGRIRETGFEKRLENMKIEITKDSVDKETLADEIRLFDLEFRESRLPRADFTRTGGYLLLGALAVFVLGVKWADIIRKKVQVPQPMQAGAGEQVRQAALARWSVAGALIVAGIVVVFLLVVPDVDFSTEDKVDDSYPTWAEISRNWHRFRGPQGAGIITDPNIPDDWEGKTGKGILWKTPVPVVGDNSPVVWGDRVFLSGGDPNVYKVFCFDALGGTLLWTGDVERTKPKPGEDEFEVMEDTGYAACTMATDGRRVYVIFTTGDVACFDFKGRKLWTKPLGLPDNVYGYASSLETYRNMLLIQFDQADAESEISKLIALDGPTGRIVWEAKRPVGNSWSTPILAQTETGSQIIAAADPWVIAYEPNSGDEIWRAECLAGDIASSPIYANGMTFVIEPYSKIAAIKTDGKGDVTKTHIAWSVDEPGPDICSPIGNDKFVFILNSDGLALCFDAADGKTLWEEDIRADFLASPSLVNGKLYLLTEKGVMIIAEPMPKYRELTRCELGEKCHASPAFVNGRIYIRGADNLYCIGKETSDRP
ncbi:MAG: PQQ-binding-like beta-propeller repeat protein [Sedimentisphaerales bacterium]|nr:PQQ-binding-like beta-propeller repeat protein [Sedimentisphaerales bacterium]